MNVYILVGIMMFATCNTLLLKKEPGGKYYRDFTKEEIEHIQGTDIFLKPKIGE